MAESSTQKNQSVIRTLQIIEIMAQERGSMRLLDIAEKVQLPASTVLRLLKTLMSYHYVRQDADTLKYSLSLKFCQIGNLVSSQISFRDVIRPYLHELSDAFQESACLAVEEDMQALYIDTVEGPDNMLRTLQRIGRRAPLHCSGVGKALLLNYSEPQLEEMIARRGLAALTPHSITTKEGLMAELERIRERGYSMDDEECELGARCVACPIRDYTGRVICAVSVSGPTNRMTMKKTEEIQKQIVGMCRKVSAELGYAESPSGGPVGIR